MDDRSKELNAKTLECLKQRLELWWDEVLKDPLRLGEGEGHSFKIFAGGDGYDHEDRELILTRIKTSREDNGP